MSDRFSLKGRRAFVTGASRGIGRALAMAFAEHGADVAINYIPRFDADIGVPDAADRFVAAARDLGVSAHAIEGDLSVDDAILGVFDRAEAALGGIDIVVCNANIQIPCPVLEVTTEQIDLQCRMNYRMPFQLMQRAIPRMAARGWGRVLTLGSVQQVNPLEELAIYAGLKSAQFNLAITFARKFIREGVTVNNISPGLIETDRNRFRRERAEDWAAIIERLSPIGRSGVPEDLVGAALLLCSDAGSFITGANLNVAGGADLCWSDA
jgi:glucose 1-dehydrogenase